MATVTKRKWANKSGRHEAWLLAFTDADGKRHKEQFPTKRAADARRIEVEGQVVKGVFRDTRDTVDDAIRDYIEHLEARHLRDARVTATYLTTVRTELGYVSPAPVAEDAAKYRTRGVRMTSGIGSVPLSKLTPGTVARLTDDLLAAGVSVSTVRRVVASLGRALSLARRNDKVAVNVARGVKVIGRRDEGKKQIKPPQPDQMANLLRLADPDMHVRLLFAARSGLRASEQWALRWRHLDLDAGEVTVETRVDIHGNEAVTKSRAGMRTVPIGRDIVAALRAWRDRSKFNADSDLVFPTVVRRKAGDRATFTRHANFYKRAFVPLLTSAGIAGFNWHSLRHYAVSQWISVGLPIKVVQTYAGHATMAITTDRYGHLFPTDSHRSMIDAIGE